MIEESSKILEELELKFTSGNAIPVSQITLKLQEFNRLRAEMKRLQEVEWMYLDLCR